MTEGKKPGDRARKSSGRGQRDLRVRVKSAKGRKLSSTLWLERQLNDPYVARAKREGYRGRAAYKILELDEKYGFLVPGARVVDLGAAPGGWSQVAVARVNALGERGGKQGTVLGVDLQEIDPIAGAELHQLDFLSDDADAKVKAWLGGPADVVMSDMAAASSGHKGTDHLRIVALVEAGCDQSAADVGAADVDREEGRATQGRGPGQRHPAQQSGIVAVMAKRGEIDPGTRELQQTPGTTHRQRTGATAGESAADDDAFDARPLGLREKAAHDVRQPLGVVLDRRMHQVRGIGVATDEYQIQLALGDRIGGRAPERIAIPGEMLPATRVEQRTECGLAGAIADEAVAVLQLDVPVGVAAATTTSAGRGDQAHAVIGAQGLGVHPGKLGGHGNDVDRGGGAFCLSSTHCAMHLLP